MINLDFVEDILFIFCICMKVNPEHYGLIPSLDIFLYPDMHETAIIQYVRFRIILRYYSYVHVISYVM